ncbi:MAG: hypothetical protein LUD72_01525, partial [Bacteroidales bacterium]|nr:hypothetical protein [Bacteroidales bacterium]
GMVRGSGFLLYKDYKFLKGVCREICIPKYKWLLRFDSLREELGDAEEKKYISDVTELAEKIRGAFLGKTYYKSDPREKLVIENVTDTMVGKILMVTYGCVPAYDTYVSYALSGMSGESGITPVGLSNLLKFVRNHRKTLLRAKNESEEKYGVEYTAMKYADMALWGFGSPAKSENKSRM